MQQVLSKINQKTIGWQTSGWNDERSSRRAKKKNKMKKLEQIIHRNRFKVLVTFVLPRAYFIYFLFLPIILFSSIPTNSQLVVDHPKNRRNYEDNYQQKINRHYNPPYTLAAYDRFTRQDLIDQQESLQKEFKNETALPPDKDRQNDLLRKLSSTMLLETLLRHPFPVNKSPFPSLPIPKLLGADEVSPKQQKHDNSRSNSMSLKQRPNNVKKNKKKLTSPAIVNGTSASVKDVKTTNSTAPGGYNLDPKLQNDQDQTSSRPYNSQIISPTIFNANGLNYLVDKLMKINQKEERSGQKRPMRQKITNKEDLTSMVTDPEQSHPPPKTKKPIITLDMLIKDEYDSRVKPMVKNLIEQQKLSTLPIKGLLGSGFTSTSLVPTNHKLEDADLVSDTTTTGYQNSNEEPKITPPLEITQTPPNPNITEAGNTLVSFEDLDDMDDLEEDDYADQNEPEEEISDNTKKTNFSTTKPYKIKLANKPTRKKLQNVPPYQLGHGLMSSFNESNYPKISDSTTIAPILSMAGSKSKSKENKNRDEKSTEASTRGSLVFSDGADEAERLRLDKIRAQLAKKKNSTRLKNSYGIRNSILDRNYAMNTMQLPPILTTTENSHSVERNDGLSLNQLLSTVNPLKDLDNKLKERFNSPEVSMNNPLIYKGYVGKDDYLFSSTARDWSKPLNTREMTTNTNSFKNFDYLPTITTPAPFTDPPSLQYNYDPYLPVTHGQSVPAIIIPTNRPFMEFTAQEPVTNYEEINNKSTNQPHSNHNHNHNQDQLNIMPITGKRKFSFQLPENSIKNLTQHSQIDQNISTVLLEPVASTEITGNNSRNHFSKESMPTTKTSSWLPTKVQNHIDHSQSTNGKHSGIAVNSNNSTSVSIGKDNQQTKVFSSDANKVETGQEESTTNDSPSNNENRKNVSKISDDREFIVQRNKSRISNFPTDRVASSSGTEGSMGDNTENEGDIVDETTKPVSRQKEKKPDANKRSKIDLDAATERDRQSGTDDESSNDENYEKKKTIKIKRPQERKRFNADGQFVNLNSKNQTTNFSITHEPAESELTISGLDKNLEFPEGKKKNLTSSRFEPHNNKPQSKLSEIMLIDANSSNGGVSDGSNFIPSSSESPVPISFGSTIIPTTNFVGEASSESPTLDNSISMLNINGKINGNRQISINNHSTAAEEPNQRSSSTNNVFSTSTTTPSQTTNLKEDISITSSASGPGITKTGPTKGTNDRLAFILIGGSCALSVICLVLAAMSMRCQDMCDDYRSLRNAERAALKLQRHRLKYTKSHQINRYNQQNTSELGQTLIDDTNIINGNINRQSTIESELNNQRNQNCLSNNAENNKSINGQEQGIWNSSIANNLQHPHTSYMNKELQACRCGNCMNHRWLYNEDMLLGNKQHLSWLSPHHYLQHHHSRSRPPFGAGSSVGTFFPRRFNGLTDNGNRYHVNGLNAGSIDAQILIENQAQHSCLGNADTQREVIKTKSILNKNNKRTQSRNEINCDGLLNHGCKNPDHHSTSQHHICHHLHNVEQSTSGESEMTIDESVHHCDNARCMNHLNNRNCSVQQKSNGSNHHLTPAWRLSPIGKKHSNGNGHHHHHHHHHQQQISSSDTSSIAQCTCSRDQQPLISSRHQKTSQKRRPDKNHHRKDKSMLVWSTNMDRLI